MPLVVADRVQQTGTANTTVSFTLSGSVTGFQSFSVIGNTNTTYYGATDTSGNWEVGVGTYTTTSPNPTLTRTTILSSSNSGSAVTFSGTVAVFVTYPSGRSVYSNGTNIVPDNAAVLLPASGGTGLSSFTANGVVYASSTSALATGSALTFNGTNLTTTGSATATSFIPSSSTVPTNGLYLPSANNVGIATDTTERLRIGEDGRLQINGANGLTSSLVATANTFPLAAAATAYQFRADATFNAVNDNAVGFGSTYQFPSSGSFNSSYQFFAGNIPALTGTAAVTNNYGVYVAAQTVGTNIYGVSSNIAAATDRWNFYANGTADNYFAGDVGIGTTTPAVKLDVVGGATSGAVNDAALFSGGVTGVSGSGAAIYLTGGGGVSRGVEIAGINTGGANNAHAMTFSTSAASAAPTERMRIDSDGNVNIATGGALGVGIAADSSITVNVDKTYTTNGTRIGLDLNTSITDSTLTASRSNYGILNVNTVTQSTALGANTLTNYGQYNQVYNGSANDVTSNATTMFGTRSLATNRAAGTVSTLYGAYNQTVNSRSGSTTASMFGAQNRADITLGTVTTAYGTYNEVQIDGGTLTTAYGTFNFFDHNGGTLTNAIGSFTNFDGTIGKKLGHIVETGSTLDFGTTGDPATANRTVTFGVVPDTSTWVSQRLGSFSTAATNGETALTVGSATTIISELLFDTTNNVATDGFGTGELASIVAVNAGSTNIGELKVFVANSVMQAWVSEASANYVLMYSPIRLPNDGLSELNWYEENTWTPVVADASTGGNVSATAAVGAFTRIGNMVTLTFSVTNLSTAGLTAANDLFIRGLPFAAKSLSGTQYFTGAVMLGSTTVANNPTLSITDNTAYIRIAETAAGASFDYMIVSEFTSGSADIYGSITYLAA